MFSKQNQMVVKVCHLVDNINKDLVVAWFLRNQTQMSMSVHGHPSIDSNRKYEKIMSW